MRSELREKSCLGALGIFEQRVLQATTLQAQQCLPTATTIFKLTVLQVIRSSPPNSLKNKASGCCCSDVIGGDLKWKLSAADRRTYKCHSTNKLPDIIFNMTDPSQYQYPSPLEGYEHLPPLPEYVASENETEKDQEC